MRLQGVGSSEEEEALRLHVTCGGKGGGVELDRSVPASVTHLRAHCFAHDL